MSYKPSTGTHLNSIKSDPVLTVSKLSGASNLVSIISGSEGLTLRSPCGPTDWTVTSYVVPGSNEFAITKFSFVSNRLTKSPKVVRM